MMKRRSFNKTVAGVPLAAVFGNKVMAAVAAASNEIAEELFEGGSPEVMTLANRVMRECVLRNIMKPQGTQFKPHLQNHWIIPGGPDSHYKGHWTWDTQFVTDLLGLVPDHPPFPRPPVRPNGCSRGLPSEANS